jgi:GTPase SAR1 family protein
VTDKGTFANVKRWMAEFQEYANEQITLFLVANKVDLPDRQVSMGEGQERADELSATYQLPHLDTMKSRHSRGRILKKCLLTYFMQPFTLNTIINYTASKFHANKNSCF